MYFHTLYSRYKLPVPKISNIAFVKHLPLFLHNAPFTVVFPVFLGACRVHLCLYEPHECGERLPREIKLWFATSFIIKLMNGFKRFVNTEINLVISVYIFSPIENRKLSNHHSLGRFIFLRKIADKTPWDEDSKLDKLSFLKQSMGTEHCLMTYSWWKGIVVAISMCLVFNKPSCQQCGMSQLNGKIIRGLNSN